MVGIERTFKALSDATRRAILHELRDGPRVAGDLAERVKAAPNALSFHLRTLKEAGLVSDERVGQCIRYTLNTTVMQDLVRFLMTTFDMPGASPHQAPQQQGAPIGKERQTRGEL